MNKNCLFFISLTECNQFNKAMKLSKEGNYHENQLAKTNFENMLLVTSRVSV
jgi:hypothetical protein